MKQGTLSQRLATIVRFIDKGSVVCDVGADHGYVSIELLDSKIAQKVYAIENKKGPYVHLQENIISSRSSAIPLFNDGLKELPLDVDTLIIAGMGARNILNILEKDKINLSSIRTLIIDSHTNLFILRKGIASLGFYIDDEEMIKDKKKDYVIIKFKKGIRHYDEDDFVFGPILRKNKGNLYHLFWRDELHKIDNLLVEKGIEPKRRNELLILKERINSNL